MFSRLSKLLLDILLATAIASAVMSPIMANPMLLDRREIERQLQTVPQWQQQGKAIARTFEFQNFVEAIAFVEQLVEPAEAAAHHPDLAISYNKVTVSLTSHDAGGLTEKDFELARTISQIAN